MRVFVQMIVILIITVSALFIMRIISPDSVGLQALIVFCGLAYLFWWLWRRRALQ